MKKVKYYLEFENIENSMLRKMEISKKEFEKQIKYLNQRVAETENEDDEFKIEKREYHKEFDNCFEDVFYFTNACADTILSTIKCKDGYCFER